MSNFIDFGKEVKQRVGKFKQNLPDISKHFWALVQEGGKEGVLNKKTKVLISLAIAIACRCDDCIVVHVQEYVAAQGTQKELEEMIGVAVYMGGGPSMMYATHALQAFDEFSQ
ncbi:MAG: hypothetical protein AMJ43_02075 [Coxiella sp. DG_40]|nr:MAG: hypothetical protein AMJ43_02075 [Coxiella sp. DG_40]